MATAGLLDDRDDNIGELGVFNASESASTTTGRTPALPCINWTKTPTAAARASGSSSFTSDAFMIITAATSDDATVLTTCSRENHKSAPPPHNRSHQTRARGKLKLIHSPFPVQRDPERRLRCQPLTFARQSQSHGGYRCRFSHPKRTPLKYPKGPKGSPTWRPDCFGLLRGCPSVAARVPTTHLCHRTLVNEGDGTRAHKSVKAARFRTLKRLAASKP
jgi:hypothetical protein